MPRKPLALAIETVDDDDDADADDATASSSTPGGNYSLSETMTFAQDGIILKGMQGMRLDGSPTSNITLADLEKQRVLGSGATSRVHLVKHRKTGELLALKELMAMADADTRRMAVNELRLASSARWRPSDARSSVSSSRTRRSLRSPATIAGPSGLPERA